MEHPWTGLSAEGKGKVMTLVATKLEHMADLRDEEFIEQLLDNERDPDEIQEELTEVLKDKTESFVDWLFFTIAKVAETDEGPGQSPQVAGLNDQPWEAFERLLNLTFVLWCNGAEINWKAEQVKLRQAVMTGLALNSPAPPPPPSSPKYPPLLVLNQMITWLKKCDFPSTGESSSSTAGSSKVSNLFLEDSDFRTYFMSTLHTMGFILNHMIEVDGENDPAKMEECLAPLAESASELFMRFVKGCTDLFSKASASQGSVTGEALYNKYKRMTGNVSEGESSDTSDLSAIAEDVRMMLSALAPPMAEIFGRSATCRAALRKHPWLTSTESLRKENPRIRMLYDLANVLDEEFLILHPGEKKGYRVFISGCSDNKLLGIALAANLIQSDKKEPTLLSGQRPNQAFIEMLSSSSDQEPATNLKHAHPWTFSIWTAVKPDGSVPSGMAGASHWIWSEGIPRQIPTWNGQRVLILQKAPFPKSFDPVRMFGGLDAIAEIKSVLAETEVEATLKDIGQATEEMRQEALKYHKQYQ